MTQEVWGGAWNSAFLTSSGVMLMECSVDHTLSSKFSSLVIYVLCQAKNSFSGQLTKCKADPTLSQLAFCGSQAVAKPLPDWP